MPVPLLIAMVLAFGLRLPTEPKPLAADELNRNVAWAILGALVVGVTAALIGWSVTIRVKRLHTVDTVARQRFIWAGRLVAGLGLAVFAATLILLDWTRVVDWGFGLRGVPLVEEIAVLAPFLLGQGIAMVGLAYAERVMQAGCVDRTIARDFLRRARRTGGLILPVAVMCVLGRDVLRDDLSDDPGLAFVVLCSAATVVFILSPGFVRLAFPLRPLPPGDLRDRLERLSRRLRFRCSDILIWDTDNTVINAGITGAIPQFRYVLLTDALVERLDAAEIEAVFGHEVGHVAHGHLPYFALFFLGNASLLALASSAVERFADVDAFIDRLIPHQTIAEVVKTLVVLACLGAYFFLVFGAISRRFERQADLYGTRAVSCGLLECPPHRDPNVPEAPELPVRSVCAEGVRVFAHALEDVALLNGMSIEKASWRHGTIASRIVFLESLALQPVAEQCFERGTTRLKWGLILGLTAACAVAGAVASVATSSP